MCGVLELVNRQVDRQYTDRDLKLLEIFARYTSVSIENLLDAQRANEMARRDDLTGLHNDRFFHHRLTEDLIRADVTDSTVALIFLDLDNFKGVNDTHGHLAGSQVLKEFGYLLKQTVTVPRATLARYGGDEFVIILPDHDVERRAGGGGEHPGRPAEDLLPAGQLLLGRGSDLLAGAADHLDRPRGVPDPPVPRRQHRPQEEPAAARGRPGDVRGQGGWARTRSASRKPDPACHFGGVILPWFRPAARERSRRVASDGPSGNWNAGRRSCCYMFRRGSSARPPVSLEDVQWKPTSSSSFLSPP